MRKTTKHCVCTILLAIMISSQLMGCGLTKDINRIIYLMNKDNEEDSENSDQDTDDDDSIKDKDTGIPSPPN